MTSAMAGVGTRNLSECTVHRPTTLSELQVLTEEYPAAAFLAGGTWLMRAPIRGEDAPRHVVSLAGIPELGRSEVGNGVRIGAMATLHKIADLTEAFADLGCLHDAATQAATPALRRMITLGGSIGSEDFSASDVRTALLCLEARIIRQDSVILGVEITSSTRVSAHERLTWRSGGEYAVVSVSASYDPQVGDIRIAIGSVERQPRRWTSVESTLSKRALDPDLAFAAAREHSNDFSPVSAPGIPGSYRLTVLPEVLARVIQRLR